VRFARSTKPGTYRFLCQVHGPSMSGAVHIVPSSQSVKSPAAVTAEGAAARVAVLQRVQPGFATLAGRPATEPLAGSGDPSSPEALITAFGPRDVKVPVGGVVSWTVIGTHSIAFNAPPDAIGLRQQDPDGSVHVSRPASVPAGGVGANAGTQQAVIDGGSWDGRGFRSSGLVFGPPPPNTTSFRLRFTRAGKYTLVCTVHPAMTGSVTVG
jgi:plastocyanin